jgi:hypothetical protein
MVCDWRHAVTDTAGNGHLTRADLERAMASAREAGARAVEQRAGFALAVAALDLDIDLATTRERTLLSLAYQGHIFHPKDHADLGAMFERLRRDRQVTTSAVTQRRRPGS